MAVPSWCRITLLSLLVVALGCAPSFAQDGPRLPGAPVSKLPPAPKPTAKAVGLAVTEVGAPNFRTSVDQYELPWSAVGRLVAGRLSCTASLIGPALLLTAAHCVFDPHTGRPFLASELHFMLGYSQGRYAAEAHGAHLTFAETYDPTLGAAAAGDDWALVELDHAVGTPDRVLALRDRPLAAGEVVTLGGYDQDKIEVLMVDNRCRVLGLIADRNGRPLIHHDCTANHGVSGAPLLIEDGATWAIGGIEVMGSSANDGGAATLDAARGALSRLRE